MNSNNIYREAICLSWKSLLLAILLLGGVPSKSVAATIAWDPLSLDFGPVQIGETANRTLTLSHPAGSTGVLTISSISLTFNDRGAFGWSGTVPVDLLPGESMEVTLSFTPPDFSFFMADLQILNNSGNAPTLIYSFLGEGSFSQLTTDVVAAVLPASRSVQVGNAATAFASIINTGNATATACSIALSTSVSADFSYQTTDPATNALVGTPNTPVDIAAASLQTYLFALAPTTAFNPTDVQLSFDCTNTDPAPVTTGLNTLLLSASGAPVPDIVALAATPTGDGITKLPSTFGANAFAVATVNLGVTGDITVTADTDTVTLPIALSVCETNPGTGACLSPPANSVTSTVTAGATPTFTIFVVGNGDVTLDPANNRVFVRFEDTGGVIRGATSVAVQTL